MDDHAILTTGFDRVVAADVALVGGKAANLGELTRAGLPVPPGFVVTTAAYDAFVAANDLARAVVDAAGEPDADDTAAFERSAARIGGLFAGGDVPAPIADAVRAAYRDLGGPPVAVRSSATAEDLAGASFAGQQDTFLNVRGEDAVLGAVVDCWASLWTARAMAYRRRQGIAPGGVSLAVVVQEMVDAEVSGVMFTADPATGRRDRVVVSAAWGLGESVVGGVVSTDDHVVDKGSGQVVSRHVADKAEMTVYAGTGTRQQPVPPGRRRAPVLGDGALAELVGLARHIEEHYGAPQDIEWVWTAGRASVVQSRPITALPEPSADPPTSWPVPHRGGLYFRASIVEQMPDPLTPLFADLIGGSVVRSLTALMAEVFGSDLRAGDIDFPTINGYAYYFYRNRGMLRMVSGTPTALRALVADSGEAAGALGPVGWRERAHPRYVRTVESWTGEEPAALASERLLRGVEELLDAGTAYYTAVQSVIPLAAASELMFRAFYDRLVRRPGDPAGDTFLLGFDSQPIRAEKSLYDLAAAAGEEPRLAAALTSAPADVLVDGVLRDVAPDGVDKAAWTAWSAGFCAHLDRFGHTVYNLDFADPVPADAPGPLLDTVRFHLGGAGTDPHERQRRTVERREAQTAVVRARLDPARRAVFDRLLRWAQETGPVREDALADMGLAWPPMRRMLRELGRRLVADGVVTAVDDVFWLRHDELRGAIDGSAIDGSAPDGLPAAIDERRMLWRGRKRATAPQMLPRSELAERWLRGVLPAGDQNQTGATIRGVAGGSGAVTAPARVLTGPADFAAMRPGEALVARITTPAWTSLFTMAAAVVTDVGGPLSHSSIVAREYGIPAVLGTGSATARIRTGQQVRVDGDAGTVTLLDDDGRAPADEPGSPRGRRKVVLAAAAAAVGFALVRRRRR
ncbi:PEP/pyruvate-binding domain-containing protein [Pseudonocardia lacus]|uniref:PEP/pyruvate-binding domain-containing protein n=1 Tax=Pseudonocardia lacus TaxID=2835865 RepID=UPI001BDDBD51|nr:PEP/pyruvate-binding domain-containing protein [Pseudonocardia lacus]